MLRRFIALSAIAFFEVANAQDVQITDSILAQPEFSNLSDAQVQEVHESMILSKQNNLASFCYGKSCYFVDMTTPILKMIDISSAASLGYFGTDPVYERLENRPIVVSADERITLAKWQGTDVHPLMVDQANVVGVLIRTRIWNKGQRFTKLEPVLIEDGVYRSR